jgi:hypothetical protein
VAFGSLPLVEKYSCTWHFCQGRLTIFLGSPWNDNGVDVMKILEI